MSGDFRARLGEQRGQLLTLAVGMVALAVLPLLTPASVVTIIAGDLIFLQLAFSWNLVGGFLGELSLGHMIFWAIGSFSLIEALNHGLPIPAVLAVAMVAAAAAGAGMALAVRLARLEGLLYVAIFTLILGEIATNIAANWQPLGASVGVVATAPSVLSPSAEYWVILGAVVVAAAVNVWVSLTRRGARWRAIRDDSGAAAATGIRITRERSGAYAVSAALCVLGGAFQAYYLGSASATVSLDVPTLILVSLAVFVGGPGTILGPLAGAIVIYGLGSVVTSVSTSVDTSLYAQVIELAAALVLLRLLAPRLGSRDLLTGTGWLFGRGLTRFVPVAWPLAGTRAASGVPATAASAGIAVRDVVPVRPDSTAPGGPPLAVNGVTRSFGEVQVLRGVSFQVEPGQVVGLIGSNGAGKSTLCNILSGLLTADQGSIRIGPNDLAHTPAAERARSGVGRSFQTPRLFASLTLRENLSASQAIGHVRAGTILRELALRVDPARVARDDDFFACRLTEVARAAALGGELLLLDEPLAGLTEQQHAIVLGLARQAADAGSRVILVEHLIPAITPYVDKLVVLAGGVVIADGPPSTVLADEAVIRAYLGSALAVEQ